MPLYLTNIPASIVYKRIAIAQYNLLKLTVSSLPATLTNSSEAFPVENSSPPPNSFLLNSSLVNSSSPNYLFILSVLYLALLIYSIWSNSSVFELLCACISITNRNNRNIIIKIRFIIFKFSQQNAGINYYS